MRGNHEDASRALQRSREAYGDSNRWYQWSVQALEARLALRRGDAAQALARATQIAGADDVPTAYATQAELIAVEALLVSGRRDEAEQRLTAASGLLPAAGMSSVWGEFLRLRARVHADAGRSTEAYHDLGQSVSVFELLGEKYQAGLSYLELGKLAGAAGARSRATRYLADAHGDLRVARRAAGSRRRRAPRWPACRRRRRAPSSGSPVDGDAALVRRIVDAAVTPALLAREGTTTLLEACDGQAAVIFTQPRPGEVQIVAAAGCDAETARAMAGGGVAIAAARATPLMVVDAIGRDGAALRLAAVSAVRPFNAAGAAALPHAVRRPAAGIRVVLGARAAGRAGAGRDRAIARAADSRASSAPARRCSASPTSSSGCRAATSPSS